MQGAGENGDCGYNDAALGWRRVWLCVWLRRMNGKAEN